MVVVIAIFIFLFIQIIVIYNNLIRLRNNANEGWSGIDVQLKRRADLVPSLVETVKGYARHENLLLEEITGLRAQSAKNQPIKEQAKTEATLSKSIHKLMVVVEDYPELKADANFLDLQGQLSEIENTLQKARRYYNGTVRELNIKIESFPSNLIAKAFSFTKHQFFALEDETDRLVPEIKMS